MNTVQITMVDELDKHILREYQKDATVSYNLLAEWIGVPTSTVFSRIKQMKKSGVIQGIIPLVNPSALGKATTAWVKISLDIDVDCCEFANEIAKWVNVMEVHEVAGKWDILIKVKVEDNLSLHDLTKELCKIPGISKMSSLIAMRTVKEDPRIHIQSEVARTH